MVTHSHTAKVWTFWSKPAILSCMVATIRIRNFSTALKFILVFFLISFTMAHAGIRPAFADSAAEQNMPMKAVAVFHCDYSPVSFWDKNTNRPSGFFVDVMDSIAGPAGLDVKYICKDGWPEIIAAIQGGEADFGVLMKSEEREKIMLFSSPIEASYLSFFARSQGRVDPDRIPDGHTVGVVRGSMSYEQLKKRTGFNLQTEGTYQEGIFRLLAGKIDLFAGEDSMILKTARDAGLDDRIAKVGKPFLERVRCLAVGKNNDRMLARLNKALQGFTGSSEYQRIYLKWYGAPAPYWTARKILFSSGLFLIIAVCGMAVWRYISIWKINQELTVNIAERKQVEKQLTTAVISSDQEKAKTEAVIAAIGDGLVIVDRDFKILYLNEVMKKMLGDLAGEVCYKAGEGRETICENCPVDLSLRDGQIHRVERTRTAGTTITHMDITSSPLRNASGEIIAVIEMVRDITGRKRAEEVLSRSRYELEVLVGERTAELTRINDQLRNLSVHLQNARENERTRIAREIHDDLGQSLTALKMEISLLRKNPVKDRKTMIEKAQSMTALVEATIESVKRISTDLRPGILDHLGLTSAIEWQAEEFEKRTGISCMVNCDPEQMHLDRDRSTTVFRIVQETLTNTARHANATKIRIHLKLQDEYLTLRVEDNGRGIAESEISDPKSLGLIGIRERVNNWGGSLGITGSRKTGTIVTVRIPLDSAG